MVAELNSYTLAHSFESDINGPIDLVIGVRESGDVCSAISWFVNFQSDTTVYIGCHRKRICPELSVVADALNVDMKEKTDGVFIIGAEFADYANVILVIQIFINFSQVKCLLMMVYKSVFDDVTDWSILAMALPVYRLAHMYGGEVRVWIF